MTVTLAALSLGVWLYLLLGRGFFWLAHVPAAVSRQAEREGAWPGIVAIVPARNEAAVVGDAIGSLLAQDYPGRFSVVMVDDHSDDHTAAIARTAAARLGKSEGLHVLSARALPPGWSGKLWALSEGVRHVEASDEPPELFLFTDADVAHHPENLRELAARLSHEGRDLVSLMVLLRCRNLAERFLIPAFVFYFAKLYPFAWANDRRHSTAAAAGGCVLIKRSALHRIGGFAAIRGALIDDCTLAKAVKSTGGSIWLGLTQRTRSLRDYPRIADIQRMVTRTAYCQLRCSPLVLAGTLLGLILTYMLPPALLLVGGWTTRLAGLAWLAMSFAYLPMLRLYRRSLLWAPLLPAISLVYMAATIDSARRHWLGAGGEWKGRTAWRGQS